MFSSLMVILVAQLWTQNHQILIIQQLGDHIRMS